MAAKGTTTANVDLDVDGSGVLKAIDLIGKRIDKIQGQIAAIVNTSNNAGAAFDRKLSMTVKELQKSMGQLNSLQRNAEGRGFGATDRLRTQRELNALEVKGYRDVDTLMRARMGAERQMQLARERLLATTGREKQELYNIIQTEKLRLAEIGKQERAIQKLEAARARAERANQSPALFGAAGLGGVVARTAAYAAAGTGIFATVNAARQAISVTIELEEKLAKLGAISGSTDTQLQSLSETIFSVARNSSYSTAELVDASTSLAQAGFSAQGIAQSLKAAADLAAASGSTIGQTTDIMTAAIGSFQLQESESTRIADGLTAALNRSRLNMEQVALGLQYVGQTASENNIRFEELVATLGTMAQAGVRSGSTMGTGLRQFLVDLQSPSKKLTETMERLGISMEDIDVSSKGLPAVLTTLASAGFNSAEAYGSLETRAAAAYLVLKNNIPTIEKLLQAQNQSGAAAEAAAKATDTFAASWQQLKNNLGERAAATFAPLIDGLKSVVDVFNEVGETRMRYDELRANGSSHGEAIRQLQKEKEMTEASEEASELYADALERVRTKLAESSDEVVKQQGKLSSLTQAIEVVESRKNSLAASSSALQTETYSLANRFSGLTQFIDQSSLSVENLILAMRRLRLEESYTLQAKLGQQKADARGVMDQEFNDLFAKISAFKNSGGLANLSAAQRKIFEQFEKDPSNPLNRIALQDVAGKFKGSTPTSKSILAITGAGEKAAAATGTYGEAYRQQQLVKALNRPELIDLRMQIDKLAGAKTGASAKSLISTIDAEMKKSKYNGIEREALTLLRSQAETFQKTPAASKDTSTKPEGAKRSPYSIYDLQRQFEKDGFSFGERVGQLTGKHKGAGHKDGRAFDASLQGGEDTNPAVIAKQNAAAVDAAKKGFIVLWNGKQYNPDGSVTAIGKGKNQHTTHMHVEAPKGGAYSTDASEFRALEEEQKRQIQSAKRIARLKTQTADKGLKEAVEKLSQSTTDEAFNANRELVTESFKSWEEAVRKQAEADTADMDASEIEEYNDALSEKIQQKSAELAKSIAESILDFVDKVNEQADLAFQKAILGSERELSRVQAQASGLDRASIKNNVPDYVRTLAQRRIANAEEGVAVAREQALPALIQERQGAIDSASMRLRSEIERNPNFSAEELRKANLELQQMQMELANLETELLGLQASSSAGQLVPTTVGENVRQAALAWRELNNVGKSWAQTVGEEVGPAIDMIQGSFQEMFLNVSNGTRTALQAFGDFAKGILRYIQQLVAKIIATKIIELLFNIVGGAMGGAASPSAGASAGFSGGAGTSVSGTGVMPATLRFNGGPIHGYYGGGQVKDGYPGRDSVLAKLAKGEFVTRSASVRSVGEGFMQDLNKNGARALDRLKGVAVIPSQAKQETNVFVVKPDATPTMGPNDVLVTIHEDILRDGATKKLIKHVAQGG